MALEIFKLMGTVAISKDKALKDIKAIQDQAKKTTTAMGKSFTKFSGYVEKHSDQIKKVGKTLTLFGGIATAAFALSVKSAAAFEEQLANVSTMLDESAMKILPEYRDGLQSLSVEFGESTETLSKGLYDILSASIPPAKALVVLGISAKAAAAGITDTGVAADAITTILNSYGMSADQAGMVSDKLFAIVKGGKTTFAELAPSIGKVAATASMAGFSFDDLGASIATMTRAGIRTEETMTAINGVLIAFLKPTDDAKEAAKEFGLTLDTTTLKTLGMTGVMEKLKNATAEQLAAIFPNIRGLKGMAAALGDAEGYARDYALMLDSAGLTQAAFEKQSATLNFKLGQLKEMFNLIKVTVGDALIPTIKDLTAEAMVVIQRAKEWIAENKPLFETLVKVGAGLGIVMLVLGPMLMILPGIISGVTLMAGAFASIVAGGVLTAIVLGAMKLVKYLREIKAEAYGLADITLNDLNVQIAALQQKASELQVTFYELGGDKATKWQKQQPGYQRMVWLLEEYNKDLIEHYKRRDELIQLTEKGVALTYDEIKAKEELDRKIKEEEERIRALTEGRKDETEGIIELLKGSEKLTGQLKVLTAEYELTGKTVEDTNKYYQEMLELSEEMVEILKAEMEGTAENTKERVAANLALLSAQANVKDLKEAIEELNKIEKIELEGLSLIVAKMSILDEKYKVIEKDAGYYGEKLKLLKREHKLLTENLDKVIRKFGEGTAEYYEALEAVIANKNEMRNWWIEIDKGGETVDEFATSFADKMLMMKIAAEDFGEVTTLLWEKWKGFLEDLGAKYGDVMGTLTNAVSSFVSTFEGGIADAIYSLLTMASVNAEIQKEMVKTEQEWADERERINKEYKDALIALLGDYVDEKEAQNMSIAELEALAAANSIAGYQDLSVGVVTELEKIDTAYGDILGDMKAEQTTFAEVMKTLWGTLVDEILRQLARIAAFWIISWILGFLGIPIPGFAKGGGIGYKLGGEIEGFDLGGRIKRMEEFQAKAEYFQRGGPKGTDTVPLWGTPGEYVISKSMTDFIRRTGVVTSGLIDAIRMGARTPTPSFAMGGGINAGSVGGGIIPPSKGKTIKIEKFEVNIFAQELNDDTIANAGGKMYMEFKRQLGMRGESLVED